MTDYYLARLDAAQRVHSRLFANYRTGNHLLDTGLTVDRKINHTGDPDAPPITTTSDDVLRALYCESDAVFVGRVTSSVSNPIEDGTFLFTDFHVAVQDVLRSRGLVLAKQQDVIVTRPGGRMTLFTGRSIQTWTPTFPELLADQSYLLFTKNVPETKAFQAAEATGTFRVERGLLVPLVPLVVADWDRANKGIALDPTIARLHETTCQ